MTELTDRAQCRRIRADAGRAEISRHSERLRGGDLADYLESHGYVERRPDPKNRRATLVCLTDRGWDEADACAQIPDELDA